MNAATAHTDHRDASESVDTIRARYTIDYWANYLKTRRRVTWVGLGGIPGTIRRVTNGSVLVKLENNPEPQHLHPADLRPRA